MTQSSLIELRATENHGISFAREVGGFELKIERKMTENKKGTKEIERGQPAAALLKLV